MQVESARLAAPSAKSLATNGYNVRDCFKKGHRPTARVIIATLLDGTEVVHKHVFAGGEVIKAGEIQKKLREGGEINLAHWRKVERREY